MVPGLPGLDGDREVFKKRGLLTPFGVPFAGLGFPEKPVARLIYMVSFQRTPPFQGTRSVFREPASGRKLPSQRLF